MGRLQLIEKSLQGLNNEVFAELCAGFLYLDNSSYAAFSRNGSMKGKQKPVKGIPDVFILQKDGKFIFIEITTNISKGISKLIEDVNKCLDEERTQIKIINIQEIIICINFGLSFKEYQKLKKLAKDKNISLKIYSLDDISLAILLKYKNLASEYLDLSFDTGQLVSREKFISEYNSISNNIATPLDNVFLHRDNELIEFKSALNNSDFVILKGHAGIGKTKLALKGIANYISYNTDYMDYYISYKHYDILPDLQTGLNDEKKYILLVDDANRVEHLEQIISFYQQHSNSLKVVLTVRDYALREVYRSCEQYQPAIVIISRLSDENLSDIIESEPFQIKNNQLKKEIIKISDGNPRIAIMASRLVKEKDAPYPINNLSSLFEEYFSTFIKDHKVLDDTNNVRCLGVIAAFHTFNFRNRETAISILEDFELDYDVFLDTIEGLERLELIEIYDEYAKVAEQNLSIYFFYKCFIRDNHLSLHTLIYNYFFNYSSRIRECIISSHNTFDSDIVTKNIQDPVRRTWNNVKSNGEKALEFLYVFWYFIQEEALSFLYKKVKLMSISESDPVSFDEGKSYNVHDTDKILDVLSRFWKSSQYIKEALSISFKYVSLHPEHYSLLVDTLKDEFAYRYDDQYSNFDKQHIFFDELLYGIDNKEKLQSILFFDIATNFLTHKSSTIEWARKQKYYINSFSLPYTSPIVELRSKIWTATLNSFSFYPEKAFNLIYTISQPSPDINTSILIEDVKHIIPIIRTHLSSERLDHCVFVQELRLWCRRNDLTIDELNSLSKVFASESYQLYSDFDWDRYKDKQSFEFDDYTEYKRLKKEYLFREYVFRERKETERFYNFCKDVYSFNNKHYDYNQSLNLIIDSTLKAKPELGLYLLELIILDQNPTNLIPYQVMSNSLCNFNLANKIFDLINKNNFASRDNWFISFFCYLDKSLVNDQHIISIKTLFRNINDYHYLRLECFEKYLELDSTIIDTLLNLILEHNKKSESKLKFSSDVFQEFDRYNLSNIELVIQSYIQQSMIDNSFDYNYKAMKAILEYDKNLIYRYMTARMSSNMMNRFNNRVNPLGFIWDYNEIELMIIKIFDYVINSTSYIRVNDDYYTVLFKDINDTALPKAKNFILEYCKKYFNDFNRMHLLVSIARYSMSSVYAELITTFLNVTQDLEHFKAIQWRGTFTFAEGDELLAEKELMDWKKIKDIVKYHSLSLEIMEIKEYLNDRIESCNRLADKERLEKFLEN